MIPINNYTKNLKTILTVRNAFDSRQLEKFFDNVRCDEKKMEKLVKGFCETYLVDNKKRPLKLRPLQLEIISKSLTFPEGDPLQHRKLAILAPRGSGKSWALSVAVIIYMFFKRFRDLVFVIAPNEDQAALIFNYVLRHFQDNTFLSSLVQNYKLHNKPHIKLKGGTILRRSPIAPTNQGQAIRGQHPTFLIVDESPLIADSLFVDNVEPSIIANKAPFINLGTPKSKENHMYRYLYDENYENSFTRLHYTWKDAVKKGEAYSPPYNEEDMLTKMLEWGQDSLHWRTEYECEFVESVSNVFTSEQIRRCFEDYEFTTPESIAAGQSPGTNNVVAIDIGKSVNSTVISVWRTEKAEEGNITRLLYLEEIGPKSGGHDIPYQRQRIMEIAKMFKAMRLILDATGIGGMFETEIRAECIPFSIHFIPFIFTGGPKGSKTLIYRDMVSFIQRGVVRVPNPDILPRAQAKLLWKWYREHTEIEYVMDAANKTEKISAPTGKHDDYCDSSVLGIHASLSMLPGESSFSSVSLSQGNPRRYGTPARTFATSQMASKPLRAPKRSPRGM